MTRPSQSAGARTWPCFDGKIAAIEDSIPAERAFEVIDARGLYVTGCGHDEIVKETRQTQQDGDGEWAIRLNGAY